MKNAIDMNISGIKCDNQTCDYKDDSVKLENYPEYVNKPCPKCGSNLLTETDFNTVQLMVSMANMMNGFLEPPKEGEKLAQINVELDGTGKVGMTIEEKTS